MLPPSIPNFTPSPVVHSLISRALGEPCPKEDLSPSDSPELGLLELVAARDVLENLIQLQGARGTFTTYPLLKGRVQQAEAAASEHKSGVPPRSFPLTLPHQADQHMVSPQNMARSCEPKPNRSFKPHVLKQTAILIRCF